MRQMMIVVAMAAAGLGLAGCVDDYGRGGPAVGYGYPGPGYVGGGYADGYGYPVGGVGYGYGYADGGYGDYYDGAYGSPYWGWSGGFYYPGFGVYVYDQYRRPFRWNGSQQRYWQARSSAWRGQRGGAHWGGFDRSRGYAGAGGVGTSGRVGGLTANGRGYLAGRQPDSRGVQGNRFGQVGQGTLDARSSGYQAGAQGALGFRQPAFQGAQAGGFQGVRQPGTQGVQGVRQIAPRSGARPGGAVGGHASGGHGGGGGHGHGGR